MATRTVTRSAEIKKRLTHPVIDADGHVQEYVPVLLDFMRQVGGKSLHDRWREIHLSSVSTGPYSPWYTMTPEERRDRRILSPTWWPTPTRNTLDRATAHLPRLLYDRLDDMGIDFAIMYPTACISVVSIRDEEVRRGACRAFNTYQAEMFREFADRITPAAAIPMQTPQEAIAELEHAVRVLGLKVAMIPGFVPRPIPAVHREHHGLPPGVGEWMDTFGVDSQYDYDPVWAKCVELGVAPAQHSGGYGWSTRQSINNFQYNGSGHFAATGEGLAKSLFMSGVTRRFPTLNFAFLEGGVAWGCELYTQMVFRWKKRNPKALLDNLDPSLLNVDAVMRYVDEYGSQAIKTRASAFRDYLRLRQPRTEPYDDWGPCKIERAEHIRELFEPRFYFGCEGEDPLVPWGFSARANPYGARLRAIFSSDIGHWDVTDMSEVLEEAYENVDKGLMSEEDFKEFAFTNTVRLYGGMNPSFFKRTRVEAQAARVLAKES